MPLIKSINWILVVNTEWRRIWLISKSNRKVLRRVLLVSLQTLRSYFLISLLFVGNKLNWKAHKVHQPTD